MFVYIAKSRINRRGCDWTTVARSRNQRHPRDGPFVTVHEHDTRAFGFRQWGVNPTTTVVLDPMVNGVRDASPVPL